MQYLYEDLTYTEKCFKLVGKQTCGEALIIICKFVKQTEKQINAHIRILYGIIVWSLTYQSAVVRDTTFASYPSRVWTVREDDMRKKFVCGSTPVMHIARHNILIKLFCMIL